MTNFEAIWPEEFKKEIEAWDTFLLDIRTYNEVKLYWEIEWTKAHYDMYEPDFAERILKLPKDQKILLYCWHGNRSEVAREWMKSQGFLWVKDLKGWIHAWNK